MLRRVSTCKLMQTPCRCPRRLQWRISLLLTRGDSPLLPHRPPPSGIFDSITLDEMDYANDLREECEGLGITDGLRVARGSKVSAVINAEKCDKLKHCTSMLTTSVLTNRNKVRYSTLDCYIIRSCITPPFLLPSSSYTNMTHTWNQFLPLLHLSSSSFFVPPSSSFSADLHA